MRISDKQIFGRQTRLINRNRAEHARLQDQAASGRRINRPSDDPASFGRVADINHKLASLEGFKNNASMARTRLQSAEGALYDATEVISRAMELTVGSLNGGRNADNRRATALEVRALGEQLQSLANTRVNGQFIFSGTRTDTPTLAQDGTYQGGGAGSLVKIGEGAPIDIAIDGSEIFAGEANLGLLLSEIADAMEANDLDALGSHLGNLQVAEDQVIDARTDMGARLSRLDLSEALSEEIDFQLQRERGHVRDADMASVISQLISREQSLQAAVQVAGRSLQPSLLDVI